MINYPGHEAYPAMWLIPSDTPLEKIFPLPAGVLVVSGEPNRNREGLDTEHERGEEPRSPWVHTKGPKSKGIEMSLEEGLRQA